MGTPFKIAGPARLAARMNHGSGRAIHLARLAIFTIDSMQRRRHRVFEFTDDPRCILRISRTESREHVELSDGTVIRRGDPILEIHFWNERVPPMPLTGPDLGWGLRFTNRWLRSLRMLARFVDDDREQDDIVAIRGESSFAASTLEKYNQVTGHMGFDFSALPQRTAAGRLLRYFVDLYVWAIVWVLHPSSLRGRSVRSAERGQLWMSRRMLLSRYGSGPEHPSASWQRVARLPAQGKSAASLTPAPSAAEPQQ